jgi:threonine/homoserine/homoserine lactone efflux protein
MGAELQKADPDLFARYFDIIRYVGAAYLIVIGLQQLLSKPAEPLKPRIRGYDADGREVLDRQLPFIVGLGPIPQR